MPASLTSASVKTFTVTGTSWKDSSRLRAVTMTSSISVVCAKAGSASTAAMDAASMEVDVPLDVSMNVSALCFRLDPDGPGNGILCLRAENGGTGDHRPELSVRNVPAEVLEAAVGRDDEVLGAHEWQRAPDARRDGLRRLDLGAAEGDHAEHDFLSLERFQDGAVE